MTTATAGNYFRVGDEKLHGISKDSPVVFCAQEASVSMSSWPVLVAGKVDAAIVYTGPNFDARVWRYDVSKHGTPFNPSNDKLAGPNTHYNKYQEPTRFFPVRDGKTRAEGVVWQQNPDKACSGGYRFEACTDPGGVYLTWLETTLKGQTTVKLHDGVNYFLVAACGNGQKMNADKMLVSSGVEAEVIFVLMSTNCNQDKVTPLAVKAFRASARGTVLKSVNMDTSKTHMDAWQFFSSGASMAWDVANARVGLMISRRMARDNDGLNHQGCIAMLLDASTLGVIKDFGQTSGHSWSNAIVLGSDGTFLAMDLGDNYPRGIHVHRFPLKDAQGRESMSIKHRVVYHFKVSHGTTPKSPAGKTYPKYSEISTERKIFYKWSNDNDVYTEIAHNGVVETGDGGMLVFFAGEQPALDNSKTGDVLNSPRNLAFVKVPFDLADKRYLSAGPKETGGFYDFGGSWSSLKNEGVVWLTTYSSSTLDENVCR